MKLKFFIICCVTSILAHGANKITPIEAFENFKVNYPKAHDVIRTCETPVYTHFKAGEPTFYVFAATDADNGFVILSADAGKDVMIGYSLTGAFNASQMPDALKFLLESNESTIQAPFVEVKEAISPMLTSKWHQTEPYNNTLPVDYGASTPSVAGCVGTAMAQLIRYHHYPTQPMGKVDYAAGLIRYSADFSEYTFDFDNMIDDYLTGTPTAAQIKAVNDLYYCCGMSVESAWGSELTTASTSEVPDALVEHFGYGSVVGTAHLSYYTVSEWAAMIYRQLENGMPVLISANQSGVQVGHAFICDGYDGNGYFHINWGWGGYLDGYFNISSLYSYAPDVDFSTSGYGKDQIAYVNICPPDKTGVHDIIVESDKFLIPDQTFSPGDNFSVTYSSRRTAGGDSNVTFGLKFTNILNGDISYVSSDSKTNTGLSSIYMNISASLPDGSYKVTPAFMDGYGDWRDIQVKVNENRYYIASVSDSKVTFSKSADGASVELQNTAYPETLFPGRVFSASANLVNNSGEDYSSDIALCICTKNSDGSYRTLCKTPTVFVNVGVGELRSVFMSGDLSGVGLRDDLYIGFMSYSLSTNQWTPLAEPEAIPITEYVAGTLVLDDVTMENGESRSSMLTLNATFHCEDGYFNGEIYMDLMECDENGVLLDNMEDAVASAHRRISASTDVDNGNSPDSKVPQSPAVTIGRHPTPVKISRQADNGVYENASTPNTNPSSNNRRYYRPCYYYTTMEGDFLYLLYNLIIAFTEWISYEPNIRISPETDCEIIYYDLNGVKMEDTPTVPGIYIQSATGDDRKAHKVIIR